MDNPRKPIIRAPYKRRESPLVVSQSSDSTLPVDVLRHIFFYLHNNRDRKNAALVSKLWATILGSNFWAHIGVNYTEPFYFDLALQDNSQVFQSVKILEMDLYETTFLAREPNRISGFLDSCLAILRACPSNLQLKLRIGQFLGNLLNPKIDAVLDFIATTNWQQIEILIDEPSGGAIMLPKALVRFGPRITKVYVRALNPSVLLECLPQISVGCTCLGLELKTPLVGSSPFWTSILNKKTITQIDVNFTAFPADLSIQSCAHIINLRVSDRSLSDQSKLMLSCSTILSKFTNIEILELGLAAQDVFIIDAPYAGAAVACTKLTTLTLTTSIPISVCNKIGDVCQSLTSLTVYDIQDSTLWPLLKGGKMKELMILGRTGMITEWTAAHGNLLGQLEVLAINTFNLINWEDCVQVVADHCPLLEFIEITFPTDEGPFSIEFISYDVQRYIIPRVDGDYAELGALIDLKKVRGKK